MSDMVFNNVIWENVPFTTYFMFSTTGKKTPYFPVGGTEFNVVVNRNCDASAMPNTSEMMFF